jgi:ABC-2 type transport system permease protein
VVVALGARAIRTTLRKAQLLVPTFVLPLMLLAIISSGTSAATSLQGFPDVRSFVAFILPGTILQGTLLAGVTGGIAMATDIELGFFDRLAAAPVARMSIVLGRLCGTLALAVAQSTLFITVAALFGARFEGGFTGGAVAVLLAAVAGMATGGFGAALALGFGKISLVQSFFPFMFILLFTTPAFFPKELLAPALRGASTWNPLTYIVQGIRAALIDPGAVSDQVLGLAAGLALAVVMVSSCSLALRIRMRAT